MLEAGFISKLIITSAIQISLFPRVIQEAAAQIGGLNYMKMEIWSTLPVLDTSYYMETQPAHLLYGNSANTYSGPYLRLGLYP